MADGPPAHDDHGQALAVATRLHATGDSTGALELLPDLVAARPDDGAVRLLLARCLAAAGTPAVALAAADAAVACDPTAWAAQAVLAQAAVTIDPERATAAAERAVELAPHEPEAHRVMAAVRAALTETPGADVARRRPGGALGAGLGLRPTAPGAATTTAPDEPRLSPRLPAALAGVVPEGDALAGPAPASPTTPPAAAPGPAGAPVAPSPDPGPDPLTAPAPAAPPAPGALTGPPPVPATPTEIPGPTGTPSAPRPGAGHGALATPPPAAPAPTEAWASPPAPPVATAVAPPTTAPAPAALDPVPHPTSTLGTGPRREPLLPRALGGTGLAGASLVDAPSDEDRIGGGRLAVRVIGLVTWLLVGFRICVQVIGGPVGLALFVAVVAWVAFLARRLTRR